jgi:uncharacterized protein (TIGR00299 family) protein
MRRVERRPLSTNRAFSPGEARVRIAYFDCFSGISGDMTLGALVDAGVDPSALSTAVEGLGINARLAFENVKRGGFRATYAKVIAPPEHAHRHLHHIEKILDDAKLSQRADSLARRIFQKVAEAEAHVHGSDLKKVHFHEVGAVDSIVDIVAASVGLEHLGVDRIEASPVPPGRGSVVAAHGRMPLPAPGTAEILKGIPLAESTADFEQTTPTGAAILATVAQEFGPVPPMVIDAIGYGAGSADPPGLANVLRLFVGHIDDAPPTDRLWMLETNLDDMSAELVGHATARLLDAGALDVFVTPVLMKKNRPGVVVSVLTPSGKIGVLEELLFRETTTLGVRRYPVSRRALKRAPATVETPFGPVKGKLGWPEGPDRPARFRPEYDDCVRVAQARDVPLPEVFEAAQAAYAQGRIRPEAAGLGHIGSAPLGVPTSASAPPAG